MKLLPFLKAATVGLTLAATLSLQAATIMALGPDASVTPDPDDYSALFGAFSPVATLTSNLYLDVENETEGSVTGTLKTSIYKLGAGDDLTFVYELSNTGAVGFEGISSLLIGGWAGFDISVAYGFLPSQPFGGVNPGETVRYPDADAGDLNGKILFTFPPGSEEPPIFAGEHGMQLILFTNATSWTNATGAVLTDTFEDIYTIDPNATPQTLFAKTYSASTGAAPGVPDGGTTALLLGAAFMSLAVFARAQARRSAA